jgi:hypothetical protein
LGFIVVEAGVDASAQTKMKEKQGLDGINVDLNLEVILLNCFFVGGFESNSMRPFITLMGFL